MGRGNSRLPHLAIPYPTSSFLDFRPFILFFRLQNTDHCCVISPISNTINGLILEIRESTVGYLWFRLRRGGGGEGGRRGECGAGVQASRPHTLHSWLPFFCIDFLRLGLLRLPNIEYYIVSNFPDFSRFPPIKSSFLPPFPLSPLSLLFSWTPTTLYFPRINGLI